MARPFAFERWHENGIYTYRHVAREGPVVERNWPGLSGEWPDGPTPYTEFGVNNNNCEEVAFYLGLIWRLTYDLMVYGVPRWARDAGMFATGAPYALISWEYEVDNECAPDAGSIRGYVPAQSSVRLWPPPGPWELEHAHQAGFFELPVFSLLRDVLRGLFSDARAELNIYGLNRSHAEALKTVSALQGREAPSLSSVLSPGEMLIDLSIGIDMGYLDVIVIHSVTDLRDRLEPIVREYEASIAEYECGVADISTVAEFNDRMRELLNLRPGLDSRSAGFKDD